MKRFLSLMLALALALTAGLALCEDAAAFRPGEITNDLFREALNPGRHLGLSISGVFEPGADFAADEEQQVLMDCVSQLLERSALRLGYARVQDGARLDFGGYILGEDGNLVYSDNAVTLNHDGIILESDLLEGRRLFVGWETILEQLGIEDTDYDELFLEMAEQDVTDWIGGWIEEHAAQALEAGMPYAGVALAWLVSLPFEPVETLPENSPVPAMPGMMRVSVTRADVSRLADAMLDQLEKPDDKVHSWILRIPMITEESLADAIEELRYNLPSETDDHPLVLTFALPGEGKPVPFALAAEYEGDIRAFRFGLSGVEAEDGKTMNFALRLNGTRKADAEEGEEKDSVFSVTADLAATPDPADDLVYAFDFTAEAEANGESLLSWTYTGANTAFTAESGQPGYRQNVSQNMSLLGGTYTSSSEQTGEWVRTEEGGESFLSHGSSEAKSGESDVVSSIADVSWVIEPMEGGLFDAAFSEILSMPSQSIEAAGMNVLVFGDEYEPMDEYLTTLYYDELSGEEISDLESELMDALRGKRNDILEVLPEPLVPYAVLYIGGQIPEDDHDSLGDQGYLDGFMEGYGVGYDDGFRAGLDAAREKPAPDTAAEASEAPDAAEKEAVD